MSLIRSIEVIGWEPLSEETKRKWEKALEDNVNSPKHYNHNHKGIEAIVAIEASMSSEEFLGYLKGNVLKYIWRYRYKNGIEDLNKATWYLNLLKERQTNVKA
jgi:hypothetical protein